MKIRRYRLYKEFLYFYKKYNQNVKIDRNKIIGQPEIRALVISNKFIKHYKNKTLKYYLKKRNICLKYKEFKKLFKMTEYGFNKMLGTKVIDFIFDPKYKEQRNYIVNEKFVPNYREMQDPKERIEYMEGLFVEFLVLYDLLYCYENRIFVIEKIF